ncbi:MAG TPA: hypothetical protein VGQ59_09985, partial [Cyclobacteriaceae bacterium]|nr:hypothetical protein [Cyclobacteriaceae bacterium]
GIVTSCGFRKPKSKESFEEYRREYFDFEFRYRNDYKSISAAEKRKQISTPRDWRTDDNEILYHEKEIEIPI